MPDDPWICEDPTSCAVRTANDAVPRTRDASRGSEDIEVFIEPNHSIRFLDLRMIIQQGNSHVLGMFQKDIYSDTIRFDVPMSSQFSPGVINGMWTFVPQLPKIRESLYETLMEIVRQNVPTQPVAGKSLISSHSDVYDDFEVPNFHARRNAGEVFFNDMRHRVSTFQCATPTDQTFSSLSLKQYCDTVRIAQSETLKLFYPASTASCGSFTSTVGPHVTSYGMAMTAGLYGEISSLLAVTVPPTLPQLAMSAAVKSLDSADLEALVTAGEGHQTVQYIYDKLIQAAQIVASVKNGSWKRYAKKAYKKFSKLDKAGKVKFLASNYGEIHLELRYALRPLVYDILGAVEALESEPQTSGRQTFRGFKTSEDSTYYDGVPIGDTGLYIHGSVIVDIEARAGILTDVDVKALLQKKLGLGNIGTMAWELTTFSFIVGWFLDVSQLLHTLNFQSGFNTLGAWVTTTANSTFVGKVSKSSDTLSSESYLEFSMVQKTVTRTANPDKSYVNLSVNLDLFKLIDLIAIFGKGWHKTPRSVTNRI